MKHTKGYSLVEVAIVLVILGLLTSLFLGGFALYRDRAEFLAHGRASELDELIAMDKRLPANEVAPDPEIIPAPDVTPEPEIAPEPEVTPDPDVETDSRPFWVRWLNWWRTDGRRNNGRRNRS